MGIFMGFYEGLVGAMILMAAYPLVPLITILLYVIFQWWVLYSKLEQEKEYRMCLDLKDHQDRFHKE